MVNQTYPKLEINLAYLKDNVSQIVERCRKYEIDVAGVIKGTTGIPQCAKMFADGGCKLIASSRLDQLKEARAFGISLPLLLLRIPMMSELLEVISCSDISLESELSVLKALNDEAARQNKIHKVILMADLGDLREGFWDKEEMVDVAMQVEREMNSLELAGVGTNLGCYGSIKATPEKLEELVTIAEKIEAGIGRRLEYISGGATTSLPRVFDGDMPKRINLLRIGEAILLARDLDIFFGYDVSFLHRDVYTLKAEVLEVKTKPSFPVGEMAVDAFGQTHVYTDRGIRKRALLGVGKVDYGNVADIFPREKGVRVIGASSDHTIVDVEDCDFDLSPGDILSFDIDYASIVYLTNCKNVVIEFV